MARRSKSTEIFVGTEWDNMVVVRNSEGKSAPTIQKRLLSFASKFGYEALSKELTSSNWDEIYTHAFKVDEIGSKASGRAGKPNPRTNPGLVTRAILVKKDRVLLYYRTKSQGWFVAKNHTLQYSGVLPTKDELKEEKPVVKQDKNICHVSHLVSADNADLTASVINTLVRNGVFPLIIDKDEFGNLSVETETGRLLVTV